jgi:hypothetical protein
MTRKFCCSRYRSSPIRFLRERRLWLGRIQTKRLHCGVFMAAGCTAGRPASGERLNQNAMTAAHNHGLPAADGRYSARSSRAVRGFLLKEL